MAKYSTIFLATLILVLIAGLLLLKGKRLYYETAEIEILDAETQTVKFRGEVEISDTALKRTRGLSGRKCLKSNEGACPGLAEGMLFLFEKPGKYSFWMAGMNFPLDIVWLSGDKIADISENIQPPKGIELPVVVSPSAEINKVLELSAGAVEKFGIKIGDEMKTRGIKTKYRESKEY